MQPLVAQEAPDFTATAVLEDNRFEEDFRLSSFRGKHVVLFFYPLDFTFVCPSEILAFDRALEEFRSRDAEIVGVSVDSHFTHLAWKKTPVERGGIGAIRFPLVSDLTKKISESYGVLIEDGVALRGLFLIDRQGIIRHAVINDLPLGRSVSEVIRILDALQFYEKRGEGWPKHGGSCCGSRETASATRFAFEPTGCLTASPTARHSRRLTASGSQ